MTPEKAKLVEAWETIMAADTRLNGEALADWFCDKTSPDFALQNIKALIQANMALDLGMRQFHSIVASFVPLSSGGS